MNLKPLLRAEAGLWVGLGLLGISLIAVLSIASMKIAPTYSRVGPQVFPYTVALVLGALGLFFIWMAIKQSPDRLQPDTQKTDVKALASISLGFVLFISTLEMLGFILAAGLLFIEVTRGFGSVRFLRDALIGLSLSTIAFLVFTRLLDLQLPVGFFGKFF
jgi:putative tricarboxylic transport membrane protein